MSKFSDFLKALEALGMRKPDKIKVNAIVRELEPAPDGWKRHEKVGLQIVLEWKN